MARKKIQVLKDKKSVKKIKGAISSAARGASKSVKGFPKYVKIGTSSRAE